MCYSNSKNKIISTSNTSMFIVDRSRQHVLTLIGSSSGLLFETSLQNNVYITGIPLMFTNNKEIIISMWGCTPKNSHSNRTLVKQEEYSGN